MKSISLETKLRDENIELSHEKLILLERFTALLHEWNEIHNLTGAKSIEAIYDNIIDAIYPITFIEAPVSLLDVGTGAGFPGMILGIVFDECHTVLCEPLNKRASFLKFAAMELELDNISVAKMRVEHLEHDPFAMISSRAVTNTELLLSLTDHLSTKSTEYLFYKGSHVFDEISAFDNQLNYDIVQRNRRNYLFIKQ
jgi:16S rRNA (guanine527-N7)-methyltransferase